MPHSALIIRLIGAPPAQQLLRVLLVCVIFVGGLSRVRAQEQESRPQAQEQPRASLQQPLDLPPMDGESARLFRAAQEASERGRYEEAILDYNQVVLLNFNSPRTAAIAHFNTGNLYLGMEKYMQAIANYERAIELEPRFAMAYNNMGEAYGHLNEAPKALTAFQQAIKLNPELPTPHYNLGVIYDMLNRPREALASLRRAVRLKPDYSLAYDALAVALTKSGRASEAIAYHQKAISLNPRDALYRFNLAISYLIIGYRPGAVEQYEQLREIDPRTAARLGAILDQEKK